MGLNFRKGKEQLNGHCLQGSQISVELNEAQLWKLQTELQVEGKAASSNA